MLSQKDLNDQSASKSRINTAVELTAARDRVKQLEKAAGVGQKAKPSLQALAAPLATGQASLADMEAAFARVDFDGNGILSANDPLTYIDLFTPTFAWHNSTQPPTNVQASVNAASEVTLTWTNNATAHGATIVIYRDGQINAGPLTGNTTTWMDTPAAGQHTYTLQVQQPAPLAPGRMSQPVSVTVAGQQEPPESGWSDVAPVPSSLQVYVSSSTGSDSGSGTQASPYKTIARGYQALRDGHPDQLLLKSGDTWNEAISFLKSSGSDTVYMVLGSYGTGPRPRINAVGQPSIWLGQNRHGVAIVDIDFEDTIQGSGYTAITGFAPASHILVEGCRINGYPTGLVFQEITMGDRIRDLKIRRNVITNIVETGQGHSQGMFIGSVDGLVAEGNVGNKIALNQMTEFDHWAYLSETDGTSDFLENVVASASSHFFQQRSGGRAINNLSLGNPINGFQGNAQGGGGPVPVNYFAYNVALNSRNINSVDQRGFGFVLSGAAGSICENNVVAFQVDGTSAIDGLDLDDFHGIVRGNVIWDWDGPNAGNPGWPTAIHVESNSTIISMTGNTLVHHLNGMLIRWEKPHTGTYSGNTYWTATPDSGVGGYLRFATDQGVGASLAQWRSTTGDTSTFLAAAPAQIPANIGDYLTSIGIAPGTSPVDTFMSHATLQSKATWDDRFTAPVVNAWVRSKFGVAQITAS